MNLNSKNQTNLYGLNDELQKLVILYENKKLPKQILLSGQKGIGKCTMAYHLIYYILSKDEDFSYNLDNFTVNVENRTFKLIQNGSNPNFILIDVKDEKKSIDISQIRKLIENLNKSSFNNKPKFILIDNIENLNLSSVNALLKILEEPNKNTHFILINSDKKVLPTIKSRCLNFKIYLSKNDIINISNKLLGIDVSQLINYDLINYYLTPGKIYKLNQFCIENQIDTKEISLENFLLLLINDTYYKKNSYIKYFIFELIEFFMVKKFKTLNFNLYNYFLKRIDNTKRFNLDEESLFIEIKSKLLNG